MKNSERDAGVREARNPAESLTSPKGVSSRRKRLLEMQAHICKTMGHPIRLFLLHHLHKYGGEVGSSELANLAGISRAAFSQHLAKMTAAGLVKTRRSGKYVYVSLARETIGSACELVSQSLEREVAERVSLMDTSTLEEDE
ncbi:MAG: winged helix-turn-helix transcriptional regulator [Planctomycetes bacterium]|nr:winged helix-turn-helix transcriptional regulator [Planctomycetota bacterium]